MATDVHAESVIEANRSLLLSWRKTVSIQMGAGQAGVDGVKMADLDGLLRDPDRAADVWDFTCRYSLALAACAFGIAGDEAKVRSEMTDLVSRHPSLRLLLDMEREGLDLSLVNPSLEGEDLLAAHRSLGLWLP